MASFFKSKHHYAESGDYARLGVYLINPTKFKLQAALGAQASLPAGFRQVLTDRSKQAGMPALPETSGGLEVKRKIQFITLVVSICLACLYSFLPAASADDSKPLGPRAANPPKATVARQAVQYEERERLPVQYGERKRPESHQRALSVRLSSLTLPVLYRLISTARFVRSCRTTASPVMGRTRISASRSCVSTRKRAHSPNRG